MPRWTNSQRCVCTVYLGWWTFLFKSNVNKQHTSMFCLFCYFFHWNSIFCCFYLAYFCVDIYSMPHFEHICSSFWIDMGVNSVWSYRYIHRHWYQCITLSADCTPGTPIFSHRKTIRTQTLVPKSMINISCILVS